MSLLKEPEEEAGKEIEVLKAEAKDGALSSGGGAGLSQGAGGRGRVAGLLVDSAFATLIRSSVLRASGFLNEVGEARRPGECGEGQAATGQGAALRVSLRQ